ncbi:hypothetical protein FO519_004784 [Halicephalobus sp. NKZ332]|nr:hypothetical protein FO519_004784 [Halicephalobus sp. NKZ332]
MRGSSWICMSFIILALSLVECLPNGSHKGSKTPKAPKKDYHHKQLHEIDTILYNSTVEFHANETWLHYRTEAVAMTFNDCVQFRYFISGTRTRLRVYMCRMNEGGMCDFYKYKVGKGLESQEGCGKLNAWMGKPDDYAVHVQFERRPRKFNDKEKEERYRKRRRLGRAAHRLVGKFSLEPIKSCRDVCPSEETF